MVTGLVSVILPVFNQRSFIQEAIDSILTQEYAFLELIVLNDGSTDNVEEVLNTYSDNRIRYYSLVHRGLPATLNFGLRVSTGEFITWFSADNIMHSTMLSELVTALRKNPTHVAAFAGYYHIDADGKIIGQNSKGPVVDPKQFLSRPNRDFLLVQNCNFGASFLYRASACKQVGEFDPLCYGIEDVDYSIRIAKSGPVLFIPKLLCYYRWHDNSMGGRERKGQENFNPGRVWLWRKIAQDKET